MKWVIYYRINEDLYCPISVIEAETIERVQSLMNDINKYGYRLIDIEKIEKEVSL